MIILAGGVTCAKDVTPEQLGSGFQVGVGWQLEGVGVGQQGGVELGNPQRRRQWHDQPVASQNEHRRERQNALGSPHCVKSFSPFDCLGARKKVQIGAPQA